MGTYLAANAGTKLEDVGLLLRLSGCSTQQLQGLTLHVGLAVAFLRDVGLSFQKTASVVRDPCPQKGPNHSLIPILCTEIWCQAFRPLRSFERPNLCLMTVKEKERGKKKIENP